MNEATVAKVNLTIAGTLVASPWWLEQLQQVSSVAALLLPIIGVGLGVFQGAKLLRDWWRQS